MSALAEQEPSSITSASSFTAGYCCSHIASPICAGKVDSIGWVEEEAPVKPLDSVQQPLRATKFCPNPAPYQAHPSATLPEVGPCLLPANIHLAAGPFLAIVVCLVG